MVAATQQLVNDILPNHIDTLFFHGRSFGDYDGLFELASSLFHQQRTDHIALFDNNGERFGSDIPYEANPGKGWVRHQLIEHGIPEERILIAAGGGYHTRWENDDFVRLAAEMNWTSGAILTQPHQILRATLGMLQAMEEQRWNMSIYAAVPQDVDWNKIVYGSQGKEAKARRLHVVDELKRVRYYLAINLAPIRQLFDYLNSRNNNKLILGDMV